MGLNKSKITPPDKEELEPLNGAGSNSENDSNSWPKESPIEFQVYKRRFYVLAVFSFASILQVILWNTWAPIADTVFTVLNWNQADIALISMWGGIISVIFCIPFAGIMDKFGIRTMFLLAETFGFIGALIRCLPVQLDYLKWTANFGQFFIALAGPFIVQGPPLVSAAWFPPHQRTTATSVASTSMIFGVAVSCIIGPLMVKDVNTAADFSIQNETSHTSANSTLDYLSPTFKQERIDEIYRMLYIECGAITLLYIAAWIYFPAKPPTPPCISATKQREDFLPGAVKLIRSYNGFWLPALAYGISIGISGTWVTQLVVMFHGTVEISQETVGWIGFYSYIGGVVGGFTASRFVDILGGKMKLVILSLLTPAIAVFVWFLLLVYKVIRFTFPSLYISTISFTLLFKSTRPIYLELVCEGVYPIGEGITIGALNWLNNIIGLVYLAIMTIPNIGVLWMNWAVFGSIIAAFLLLVVFKEDNKRLAEEL